MPAREAATPRPPDLEQQTAAQADRRASEEAASEEGLQPPDEQVAVVLGQAEGILAALESAAAQDSPGEAAHPGDSIQAAGQADAEPPTPEQVSAVVLQILRSAIDDRIEASQAIDDDELEDLAIAVAETVRRQGSGPVLAAIRAVTSEPPGLAGIRLIAQEPDPAPEVVRRVTSKLQLTGGASRAVDGKLILAAALLLATGAIAIPLLAGAVAEVVLTNEIAVAALIVAIAALRKS